MEMVHDSRREVDRAMDGAPPSTLVDVLVAHAQTRGSDPAYTFLSEHGPGQLTYSELESRARSVAVCLRRLADKGDRVLLLLPPGLEFVVGFCGCLYGGLIAVPAYPPHRNRGVERLQAIAADCGARVILTTQSILKDAPPHFTSSDHPGAASWIAFEDIAPAAATDWRKPDLAHNDVAFLQYTSGSTATPKGVIVSHGNLMANEEKIRKSFGQDRNSVIVSWLPLYHDMGLIGSVLQSLYVGARCILLSPVAFLQSPVKWLQAISDFRATTSGGPNFAYDLCVRRVTAEELAGLNLSNWTVAFNGAEPVRAETLERFASRFAASGFRREAFRPCYGLAESTLLVTAGGSAGPVFRSVHADTLAANRIVDAAEDSNSRVLVGCGSIDGEDQLRIVNPSTLAPCAPGEVGEIWLSSPSVAQGYWRKDEATKESFFANMVSGESGFLRTGDLGAVVAGQMFVTGRLKDLIIIRGRNHYPQDIERTVESSHPALRQGCGAAFSVEAGGEERLVVVQEIDRGPAVAREALARIKAAVSEEHELQLHAIALVQRGAVPKTSSGKIQRHLCRSSFIAGALPVVESWMENLSVASAKAEDSVCVLPGQSAGAQEVAQWLRSRIACRLELRLDEIDPQGSIVSCGIDSLAAVELAHEIESALGVSLPFVHLFQETSIHQLAAEIVQRRNQGAKTAAASSAAAAGDEGRPSRGQNAMWFLHRMAPESTAYNIAAAASIRSALQVENLQRAFELIVARHDSLRTVFPAHDGRPVRRVRRQVPGFFEHVDASGWTEAELDQELSKEANHKCDLESGPLFRIVIFSSAPDRHVLLMVAHHIIADFWSLSVVLRELDTIYAGHADRLPPASAFDEYVHCQETMLSSSEGRRHWSFWNEQFSGEIRVLDLPADHTRPVVQTYSGAAALQSMDRELALRLKHLAKSREVTLYTVLLSAFEALLYRYTGQASFAVGTPVANRNLPEFTGLVGLVANTVAVKAEVSGDLTAVEFMHRTRERVLAALEHQEYPFALLVELLQPVRDPSRSPLFQVMFAVNKIESHHARNLGAFTFPESQCTIDLGGIRLQSRPLPQCSSQFDLTLRIAEDDEGIKSCFEYNTGLFQRETIQRMAGHYHRLLDAITQNPSQSIKNLPLLTEREEKELLHWNQSRLEVPLAPMHVLFEEQSKRSPGAVAVVFEGGHLTYAELDRRANQLAHYLRQRGVGPESRVGVLLERSLDMVVALLAILKSGGAYVPMDPEYPAERLSFMMSDASMRAVVTSQGLQEKLAGPADLIFVDAAQKQIAGMPMGSPDIEVSLGNAAYVIYTSGSTGIPKGVMVHHLGLVNLLGDMRARLAIGEKDRWLSVTTISFDIAALELYLPLITGGQLWLAGRDDARSSKRLCRLLEQSQATIMQATPVTWQSLIEESWPGAPRLTVLCGGEAMPRSLAHELLERSPVVWNVYGPTETTIWSSSYRLVAGVDKVLIGHPLANTQLHVLDQEYQPAPVGVAGELYIGGAGVARGYLHRPDLSAERFVPDPFGEPGGRLYKTGDLARFRSDGNVEFVGRADNQVKFRGFRIELGEIEACLGRHPAVEQVAVVRRGDGGKERLIAYVVPRNGGVCAGNELRDFVKQSLPEYMAPSLFVILAMMPLTPNGKIDRNALPQPEQDARQSHVEAPRNATEEILAGIWRQVLGKEQAGITDNFFELGGHSLLAAQVNSRIADAFGLDLPLRTLFEDSTIEALARRIEQAGPMDRTAPLLQPVPREQASGLSFAQQRMWFLDQLEPGDSAYHVRGAVRLKGRLQRDALESALNGLITRHEILRTRFVARDGVPEQVIDAPRPIQLQEIDITRLPEEERTCNLREISRLDLATPFHLAQGPLFRATLVRTGPQERVLLVNMHHIVSDGWSIGILISEVAELYNASVGQREPKLQPLAVQYADYVVWQRQWLNAGPLQRQLEYWKKQLDGVPPLELPSQRPAPVATAVHLADRVPLELSVPLTAQLRALSQRENSTLFMILAAALHLLLYRCSGQTDITVGTPIANRARPQIEGLVGFFVNVVVLRTLIDPEKTFRDFLKTVREVTLQAYAHQDVPFEKIVEDLAPGRDRKSPFFRCMLVLQSAPVPEVRLDGLEASQEIIEPGKAKFDLTLSLEEKCGRILGFIEYDTDVLDRDTVQRMASHYQTLMEAVVVRPEDPLWSLAVLTAEEREQLLLGWNRTRAEYPREKSVAAVFEECAEQTPDAIALVCEGRKLSYAELNLWANKLAHYLRKSGVRPEARVAVCMERSFDMIIALLGILKAGGAYVPLDPEYPGKRLEYIVTDTAAEVVLTSFALQDRVANVGGTVVCLDSEWEKVSLCSAKRPNADAPPEGLAYVLYTSGSTGDPKGVAVTHQSILRLVKGANYARLGPEETILQFAPLSFDASTFEIWGALLNGGRLAIAPAGKDALQDLGGTIRKYQVTTLWLTAALFHQIAEREPESLAGVKQLLSGGDVVSPQAAVHAMRQGCTVINGYGPTENTTFTSCYTVPESQAVTAGIPIGRPISNTEIYVLDEYLQPAPIGVPGELYTGGDGLARGYWGEPRLTAAKFVPNPFGERPGSRLYKTGDLVCYRADGNLIFLGRKDQQVKIRGYRIEPGEIEARLGQYAGVGQAVVIARDFGGDKQLVAYIMLQEGAEWSPESLRDHLKERLPGHMIPAHFVRVQSMPITGNGKVDRKRLLELELEAGEGREFVPPGSASEELLANIWREVLRVERVGATDNFFALGGHSLLATQVISRVRQTFQVDAPLRLLFESRTLAEMAEALAGNPQSAPAPSSAIRRVTQMQEELLITQIESMSEEEVDNLIETLSVPEPAASQA